MRTARFPRLGGLLAAVAAVALVATGCGDDDDGGSAGGEPKGNITVGSANFGEAEIIANMYSIALSDAGYQVTDKFNVGSREVYIKAMENGEIDVVPEYIGTLTEYFNAQVNGQQAAEQNPLASGDVNATFTALKDLATQQSFVVLEPSDAADQNAFAVTKEFADSNALAKLSDLTKLNGQLVLGGPPECDERPFCRPGLEKTYGLQFKGETKKLDAGGPKTIGALKDGSIQVGLVFSSDGAVVAENLVVLEDDKSLQTADNITGLCRDNVPAEAQDIVNKVNQALTTEKLQDLNKSFNIDKEDAKDLAEQFLTDAGLM
jgi:osmoprotectant transport system substrate-binding protein